MQILLFLLKILGILLLCLIIVLLIILFHPIFYKISGKIEEKAVIQGKVRWLFKIIGIDFFVNGTNYSYSVKMFGRQIVSDEKTESDDENEQDEIDKKIDKPVESDKQTVAKSAEDVKPVQENKNAEKTIQVKKIEKNVSADEEKESVKDKFYTFKSKLNHLKEKIASILELLSKIKTEIKDEKNRQALVHVWQEVIYILRKLKPRYVKAELDYGTEDPALTGQITGVLSMLPLVYKYDAHIYPDFLADKIYIQGDFFIKGHVYPWHIVLVVIRLFKDRNLRRMIYRMKKLGGNA